MKTDEFNLSDLAEILSRHSKTIYKWVIGVTIAGVFVAYLYPPEYNASAKVIVSKGGQNISLSERSSTQSNVRVTIEDEINTEMEIIRSRPVIERVVEKLQAEAVDTVQQPASFLQTAKTNFKQAIGSLMRSLDLRPEVSPFDVACAELNENITLNPILDSSVIEISATADSPALAARIANLITEEYREWHLEVYRGRGASQFYTEKVTSMKEKLEKLEDELTEYKEEEGLVSINDTKANLLDQLSILKISLSELSKDIVSEESRHRIIVSQMKANGSNLIPTLEIGEISYIQEARNKLMDLELRLNELKQKYTTTHRDLTNLEGEIKLTRKFIKNEVQKIIDLKEVNLKTLRTEREALNKVIDDIQAQINELPRKELVIQRLERSIEETKDIYSSLSLKMEESNITESSDERVVSIRLISAAHPPLAPSFPNKIMTILLSPFLGLVCGLAAAFVTEFGARGFFGSKDIEDELDIVVVAELPEQKR